MSFARVPAVEGTPLEAETDTLFVLGVEEVEVAPAYQEIPSLQEAEKRNSPAPCCQMTSPGPTLQTMAAAAVAVAAQIVSASPQLGQRLTASPCSSRSRIPSHYPSSCPLTRLTPSRTAILSQHRRVPPCTRLEHAGNDAWHRPCAVRALPSDGHPLRDQPDHGDHAKVV